MDKQELARILKDHEKRLKGSGGAKANLREANLRGANLREANLKEANLWGANLREANLKEANLKEANLWGANLRGANLWEANLWGANLREANLRGANLKEANLREANLWGANLREANLKEANLKEANLWGANLRGANLWEANLKEANLREANLRGANLWEANLKDIKFDYSTIGVHPAPEGDLIGWGKKDGYIVKLLIPKEAHRSCATTRKYRAEYAICLEIEGTNEVIVKNEYATTIYRPGEKVVAHEWCEDRWKECAGGIHFFLTRKEAEEW